jgi:hypothetical protein
MEESGTVVDMLSSDTLLCSSPGQDLRRSLHVDRPSSVGPYYRLFLRALSVCLFDDFVTPNFLTTQLRRSHEV